MVLEFKVCTACEARRKQRRNALAAEARRQERQRKREEGQGWLCIIGQHAACHGRVGYLTAGPETRPECTCPHHQDDDWEW